MTKCLIHRYHSLHHTKFRTNYSLFMPLYDYIYSTVDKSTDTLYEVSLNKEEEIPHVVHLTHLTTLESIYHLRFGFASLASSPHTSKWYMWLMWPLTLFSTMLTWNFGRTFVVERHRFNMLSLQTWVIPKNNIQVRNNLTTFSFFFSPWPTFSSLLILLVAYQLFDFYLFIYLLM
jgi:aldehyde decarbonylase